jgi:hypothetical protein
MHIPKKLHHLLWVLPILFVFSVPKALAVTTETKIMASDGAAGNWFGQSVSIDGDYAIVGSFVGAYVFYKDPVDGWTEQKKLVGVGGDSFGSLVAISGTNVIVSATGDDEKAINAGAAYIFSKDEDGTDNWGQVKKLTASDGVAGDSFGGSVFIDGDYAIIGAEQDQDHGYGTGAAYVFYNDPVLGWTQQKKLTASDGATENWFGESSISGDYAIVGARMNRIPGRLIYFTKTGAERITGDR